MKMRALKLAHGRQDRDASRYLEVPTQHHLHLLICILPLLSSNGGVIEETDFTAAYRQTVQYFELRSTWLMMKKQ